MIKKLHLAASVYTLIGVPLFVAVAANKLNVPALQGNGHPSFEVVLLLVVLLWTTFCAAFFVMGRSFFGRGSDAHLLVGIVAGVILLVLFLALESVFLDRWTPERTPLANTLWFGIPAVAGGLLGALTVLSSESD